MNADTIRQLLAELPLTERRKVIDWFIGDASDTAVLARAWDIRNATEQHM